MNRLKIVKNIELKKNKSMNNISNKQMEGLKFRELKRKRFCKIYRYYSSKDKLAEKLMYQGINKMVKELKEKQEKETKDFNDVFHKNYPPESETDYENQIQTLYQKEKTEIENYETIRKKFFRKKHYEYISKMGIEFEKGFDKLNQKFKKETEEQTFVIRKIILNHQLKEIEKNNMKDNNKNKEKDNDNKKNVDNNRFYFSQFQFYLHQNNGNQNKKSKENKVMNKLSSKIFKFNNRGKIYKTIIL